MDAGLAADRFELIRPLGSGGFGDVYAARDRSTGTTVALKKLRQAGPSELLRFKREFRRVAQLVHPNLVRLYELIQDEGTWFFTMELISGSHLLDHFRQTTGAARDGAVRSAFVQIVTALEALHAAGIAHRDVKPSNVMVTAEGRVVLLDFGVAKEIAAAAPLSVLIGTPSYVAPERLAGAPDQESGDWYSVGVMLYEALTGQLPFTGEWVDIVRAKQERDPIAPARISEGVADDLSALSMALLDRDPSKRPTGSDILRALTVDRAPVRAEVTRRDRPPFVGRATEIEVLWQALDTVLHGSPAVVHVTGPSGVGKTTLVRRFLDEARESSGSAAILTGACHQQEAVAFNALDEFVDHLSDHLTTLLPSELAFVLPPRSELIGRVFPVFRSPSPGAAGRQPAESTVADPVEVRRLAFAALKALLVRLCERAPVIVVLDDVQWADRDSALFLDDLLRGSNAPPLLLILGYRQDEPAAQTVVESLRAAHAGSNTHFSIVELTDLSAGDAETLVRALLDQRRTPATAEQIQRLAAEADGSPFFIYRLVQQAALTPERIADIRSQTVISDTIDAFTPIHRRVIELVAVAGRPLPADVCIHAAMRETEGAVDLGRLFAARILQLHRRGSEDLLDIYHDRIRAHVLRSLPPPAVIAHHKALVDSFLAVRPRESDSLVHHCEQAGLPADAARYAVAAGHQASHALAFERAVSLYKRALDLGVWDAAERRRITVDLARALSNAGRGVESARVFLEAAGPGAQVDDVRLRISAADQYLRAGYLSEGDRLLKRALADVRLSVSDHPLGILSSILFHRARASRLLKQIDRAKPKAGDEWQSARLEVLWAAAVGLSMADPVRSADYSARHLYHALSSGSVYRIALALAGEATQMAHTDGGRDGKPREFLETALRYAVRSGEPHAVAFVHCMAGIAAFLGGRWTESVNESEKALELLREKCTGVSWEIATAATFLCASHVFRGDLAAHGRLLPTFVADASARGDLYAAEVLPALTLSWVTALVADDPDKARKHLPVLPSIDRPFTWRVQDANAVAGLVDVLLYEGRPDRAWAAIETYWKSLSAAIIMRVVTVKTLMSVTRMRCAIALAASADTDPRMRRMLLAQAERDAQFVERTNSGWAGALARTGFAGILSVRGQVREALALLDVASGDLLASELMPWYHAVRWHLSRRRAAETGTTAPLEAWWIDQRVANPERIAKLLVPGIWE